MKIRRLAAVIICLLTVFSYTSVGFAAGSPTDEILDYKIDVSVNDDGTVNLKYHIDWEVLESDGIGPVEWVTIGIPNGNYIDIAPIEDDLNVVDYVEFASDNGSSVNVYFNDLYYEGEIVSFDFMVVQDYMYCMNQDEEGITTYSFTPGWFDSIDVDNLTIRWESDKVSSWYPDCKDKDGFLVWNTSLPMGDTYTVKVYYPNDAFNFSDSKFIANNYDFEGDDWNDDWDDDWDDDWNGGYSSGSGDFVFGILGLLFFFGIPALIIRTLARAATSAYRSLSGFGTDSKPKTKQKITRTKVKYYPVCQGCGAAREDGQRECPYCGRSFVESEEIIEEENLAEEDKEALKYKKDGEYHYSSSPNTFVRVNVVNIPIPRPAASHSGGLFGGGSRSGGSGGRGGGGHTSSRGGGCAHSSCACACVSCACACACACAGGGRAGCTTKDFYKTGLKLTQIEKAAKKKA